MKIFGQFPGGRHLGDDEIKNVTDVISSRSPYRFSGLNLKQYCNKLESEMSNFVNKKHCLVVNTGTAALHCALHACGIKKGDEVIVPAYGWSADLMTIVAMGATPVIAPVSSDCNLDLKRLDKCISKNTKALIVIHMRGYPCDFSDIIPKFKSLNIPIIEDCSQCFGGMIDGQRVGHLGDYSTMSFQYNKMITAGEGGAIMMNDKESHEKCVRFHNLGMDRKVGEDPTKTNDPIGPGSIVSVGLNYRMSEITASVALAQLKKIKKIISGCKSNWDKALKMLEPMIEKGLIIQRNISNLATPNYAFLGFKRSENVSHKAILKNFSELNIPFEHVNLKDSHHFEIWKFFLDKEKYPYKDMSDETSNKNLEHNYFCEILSE
jgi:8-amino-3,8-dideoxy-alpha-D-manno-octulosonate transaminase|tara:strand:+ start:4505 stop:5638 length:1134 start_codon:yes stop_codon:yes gene_type:complete